MPTQPNCIDAQLEFDFRGEHFCLTATVELDKLLHAGGELPPIYTLIAAAHKIDPYSYQYEVMEMADITYANPQGLACQYFSEGLFDEAGFVAAWQEQRVLSLLAPIAKNELGIEDLNARPEVGRALLKAYRLGAGAGNPSNY